MDPTDRALFLSLRPTFAEMILSGHKTVELRRVRPRAPVGTLVIVYATSPVRAVLGTCIVQEIGTGSPDEIWDLHGPRTGVSLATFMDYFVGRDRGVAITVRGPARLSRPVALDTVRRHIDGFAPPQSFRYVHLSDAKALFSADQKRCGLHLASV